MLSNEQRLHEGAAFLSFLWASIAEQVVETAIQIYELSGEQSNALRRAFLMPNNYSVTPQ